MSKSVYVHVVHDLELLRYIYVEKTLLLKYIRLPIPLFFLQI